MVKGTSRCLCHKLAMAQKASRAAAFQKSVLPVFLPAALQAQIW